jgi:hypothetical protein
MDKPGFRILYENDKRAVTEPVRYEDYDIVPAMYDYQPAGPRATIRMDGYALELTDLRFINWARESLPLAERIAGLLDSGSSPELRRFFPDLPTEAKIYHWIVADAMMRAPVLVFAATEADVWIYSRTADDVTGLELILSEWNVREPVVTPRRQVIQEIRDFLERYLDDVSDAFPFLRTAEEYPRYRSRIAALRT